VEIYIASFYARFEKVHPALINAMVSA